MSSPETFSFKVYTDEMHRPSAQGDLTRLRRFFATICYNCFSALALILSLYDIMGYRTATSSA